MSRIAAIPLIVILLYFDAPHWRWLALGIFAAACITDFFDGYLARSRKQVSDLGRFLDPIADKLLVAAVILILVAEHRLTGWTILPALIILCREILVSGCANIWRAPCQRSRQPARQMEDPAADAGAGVPHPGRWRRARLAHQPDRRDRALGRGCPHAGDRL
jgi:Phosphatidylglycerophosphate synthase